MISKGVMAPKLGIFCPSVCSTSCPVHNLNTKNPRVIELCQLIHLGQSMGCALKSGHCDLGRRLYG
jgi:hypothetical protein